jgi:D-alanine-D-alanine ligase
MASALGMDKWRTKLLWRSVGLPIPEFTLLTAESDFAAVEEQLGLPIFVKPVCEGSSIGISKVTHAADLRAAFDAARIHDASVIAERAILGGEYTVAILGNDALPIIKIEPASDFYDYDAKYLRDDTRYRCPCDLPQRRELELRAQALEAFRVLGGRGWGRVDFLMDEAGQAYFLEANTSPGMTDHSLVPLAAAAAGIPYDELVIRVLALADLG